jgi:hypothetical protein
METARSLIRTSKGLSGRPARVDYRKLSNGELHRIFCVVDPTMSRFVVTDETRETVIAMLQFVGAGNE